MKCAPADGSWQTEIYRWWMGRCAAGSCGSLMSSSYLLPVGAMSADHSSEPHQPGCSQGQLEMVSHPYNTKDMYMGEKGSTFLLAFVSCSHTPALKHKGKILVRYSLRGKWTICHWTVKTRLPGHWLYIILHVLLMTSKNYIWLYIWLKGAVFLFCFWSLSFSLELMWFLLLHSLSLWLQAHPGATSDIHSCCSGLAYFSGFSPIPVNPCW